MKLLKPRILRSDRRIQGVSVERKLLDPERPARVFILLRDGLSPAAWSARLADDNAWEDSPYGYGGASAQFSLTWSKDLPTYAWLSFVRRGVQRVFGADILHVLFNLKRIRAAEVVWTHTEREHLALLLLLPFAKYPHVVAQSVWLWDRWDDFGRLRRRVYSVLLRRADIEIVHSRINLNESRRQVTGRRVELVPFGTTSVHEGADDGSRTIRAANRRPQVLSAGNDHDRDWATLAACAREMTSVDFVIFTSAPRALSENWPTNVEIRKSACVREMRAAYVICDLVVLPLQPNKHASGATVAGESMSAGRPLVVAKVGGIEDYVDGPGTHYYDSGDTRSMSSAIWAAIGSSVSHEEIALKRDKRGLTPDDYVRRYEWISAALLCDAKVPETVSAFEAVPALPPFDELI